MHPDVAPARRFLEGPTIDVPVLDIAVELD
jgi:hypothetical protein